MAKRTIPMTTPQILTALMYTLIAGSSTGIGGLGALFMKRQNLSFLSGSLGFSAGVMIYIALGELLDEADALVYGEYGNMGGIITAAAFFGGMILIAAIDKLIPDEEITSKLTANGSSAGTYDTAILRTGLIAALAMAIHNFPEGLATFISAAGLPETAPAIVTAIAIHNIPEGMAVAVPVYMASGSRRRAFGYSLLSGLTEPLGAIFGCIVLYPYLNNTTYAILYAVTAGIMTYIAISELIPASHKYGPPKYSVTGTVLGMAVMAAAVIVMG